jgi:serine/threonine protein kinase
MNKNYQYMPGQTIIGKYLVKEGIGRGAFGEVYCVTHIELDTTRAVKILRRQTPQLGSTEFSEYFDRFKLEARLGAQFNSPTPHPNLIQVHNFQQEGNLLVLEMEYAPHGSLADRIKRVKDGKPISISDCIRIAIEIARGLATIHAEGVIHRDLKPSNILFDAKGVAKVADFGLAQIPDDNSFRSILSDPGKHPGTRFYMSPEQKESTETLHAPSDLYSLGLILYEMLTGEPLFKNDNQRELAPKDIPRYLADGTLPLPQDVPPELNGILGKALMVNPLKRYQTAADFITDLEAVRAKLPAGSIEREKTIPAPRPQPKSPNWLVIGASGLGIVLLLIISSMAGPQIIALIQNTKTPSATAPQPTTMVSDVWTSTPASTATSTPTRAESPTPTSTGSPTVTLTESPTPTQPPGDVPATTEVTFQAKPLLTLQVSEQRDISSIAFSFDGALVASADGQRVIKIWQISDGKLLLTLGGQVGQIDSLAFSPDGKWLASAGMDSKIRIRKVSNGAYEQEWDAHRDGIAYVGFSYDGARLASGGGWNDAKVQVWNPTTGARIGPIFDGPSLAVRSIAFAPQEPLLAAVSTGTNVVWVWDTKRLLVAHRLTGPLSSQARAVLFSPDGGTLASGWKDGTIQLWDITPEMATPQITYNQAKSEILSLAFSPDGKWLAAGAKNGSVFVWDLNTDTLLVTLREQSASIWAVAFAPDGKTLLAGSEDGKVQVWEITP